MKRTASSIEKAAPVCKRRDRRPLAQALGLIACALLLLSAAPLRVWGDQVEMQNGDRYVGQVLSLNTNTVVLQSDRAGDGAPAAKQGGGHNTLALSRQPTPLPCPCRRTPSFPPHPQRLPLWPTNLSPALHGLSMSTNLIQQVQKQFLSGAGPEANASSTNCWAV